MQPPSSTLRAPAFAVTPRRGSENPLTLDSRVSHTGPHAYRWEKLRPSLETRLRLTWRHGAKLVRNALKKHIKTATATTACRLASVCLQCGSTQTNQYAYSAKCQKLVGAVP